jgi:hypothetical protein
VNNKLFISIASYNDPLLWFTVKDAYDKATHKDQLVFGIFDQSPYPQHVRLNKLPFHKQIKYVHIHTMDARGACWARAVTQTLLADERYFMQIDSHTWFERGWDDFCIRMLHAPVVKNLKRVYTSYPRAFEFKDKIPVSVAQSSDLIHIFPKEGVTLKDNTPAIEFASAFHSIKDNILAHHVAGGFIFSFSQFAREVPYDPNLYFLGEEQTLAVRAWTHGWDLIHPPYVPLYHYYGRETEARHWTDGENEQRTVPWWEFAKQADQRMADMLYHGKDLGAYGLGTVRTLADFALFCGIDYESKTIDFEKAKNINKVYVIPQFYKETIDES